jgi:glucose-6-phosphate isomerase
LTKQLGEGAVKKHFFAVSSNVSLCEVFGIHPDCILPMWDWVGGRFSLWSAVGFSIAIAIGMDHFKELLNGASSMDEHFLTAPNDKNIPVLLALLGIWNGTLAGIRVQVVLPYADALRELPRYLQQLEMESNGKSVTREAAFVDTLTVPVLFGEPGTIGQHSFYQWLHQGSDRVMADFIGVVQDDYHLPEHHQALLANMVAQSTALAFGKRDVELLNNVYLGNKPCNLIMLDKLDPYSLGMLLALYEHKVFVQSIIWNINPFDQPGVELGKVLANKLLVETEHAVPADRFMQQFYNIISKSSGE